MTYHYASYENRVYRFPDRAARDGFVWDCQAKPRTRKQVEYAMEHAQPWQVDDITGAEYVTNPTKGKV